MIVAMSHGSTLAEAQEISPLEHVSQVVKHSGTSFAMGMKVLPKPRREAMYAIYAFCREVDDVADEPGERQDKLDQLAAWRLEIDRLYSGQPSRPTTKALRGPVQQFDLPKDEFLAIIDGMEMDAREAMVAPSLADFELYCRRVAGAVGMLSIRAFGADEPEAREIAITLGEALQITNILRDLGEDADRGRLYLPSDLLAREGIETREPTAVLDHPALPAVLATLAEMARERFAQTKDLIGRCRRRPLRPCILMMEIYSRTLDRLEQRGWERPRDPIAVPKWTKIWIALRHGLL